MTRDEAIALIAQRCGKRTDLTAAIAAEMVAVQAGVLEGQEWWPWFLESEIASTGTVVGEERVLLPDDFLAEIEDQSLWLDVDGEYVELTKEPYDILVGKYTETETDQPAEYAVTSQYFLLKPTPDAVYPLRMRYYARGEALTSNIENVWLKHASDLVIAEVGAVIAGRYILNGALEDRFKLDAQSAWKRLHHRHVAFEMNGRTLSMGDD